MPPGPPVRARHRDRNDPQAFYADEQTAMIAVPGAGRRRDQPWFILSRGVRSCFPGRSRPWRLRPPQTRIIPPAPQPSPLTAGGRAARHRALGMARLFSTRRLPSPGRPRPNRAARWTGPSMPTWARRYRRCCQPSCNESPISVGPSTKNVRGDPYGARYLVALTPNAISQAGDPSIAAVAPTARTLRHSPPGEDGRPRLLSRGQSRR